MKKLYKITAFLFAIILLQFYGCGDRLDLSQFPITNNGQINVSDTLYVQQYPDWTNFNFPEGILIGKEPLVYVADTKNNRIVQMDLGGGFIGDLNFGINVFPKKIAQDYNFDLLVVCDSISVNDTISIVYRLKLVAGGGIISNARKIKLIESTFPTPNTSKLRKFKGISVYPDNSYIVTRRGPDDPYGIDPGNALLHIRGVDSVTSVTVLGGFQSSGNSFYSLENVAAITVVRNSTTDFILTRSHPDTATLNKVLWFQYDPVNGTFDPRFTSPSLGIVSERFGEPEDVTMDVNYNVYVVDAMRHKLYKFNSQGNLMKGTFGSYGGGENQLNSPHGVAHFDKVLYIADTGNNRIVRFKLSTDIN